jgi:hypothetical protein
MESTNNIVSPIATPSMYPTFDRNNRNHNNFRTQERPNNSSLNPLANCCDPTRPYCTAFTSQITEPPLNLKTGTQKELLKKTLLHLNPLNQSHHLLRYQIPSSGESRISDNLSVQEQEDPQYQEHQNQGDQ